MIICAGSGIFKKKPAASCRPRCSQRFTVMQQMKASHCLTEMADALEMSRAVFLPINAKQSDGELNRTSNYLRRSSRSLWPAARLMAVHASCCAAQKRVALWQKSHRPAHELTRPASQTKTTIQTQNNSERAKTAGGAKLVGQDPKAGTSGQV